ncbi:MAG: putative sulfate/molybdate transporter [Planctomycetota bacterium]
MNHVGNAIASARSNWAAMKFDRNELSGAFGDIGTDLPLIVGMILASGLDTASVLIVFGAMQLLAAFIYGLPMPVQPLKAVAALVIAQKIGGNIIYGAGLAIGITMLLLTVTGLIDWLARVIPKSVIRGIQFGLGLKLASIALKNYVMADGISGCWLAVAGAILTVFLIGNRKYPAAIFVILLGVVYALIFKLDGSALTASIGFDLPKFYVPTLPDIVTGFLVLALPQIPLSLGNSIFATQQLTEDLFPERSITVRKISFTYALINIVNPFLSGIPTCHGSGGMAGHYAFGARTGGSVVIYGSLYLLLGLFFSAGFEHIVQIFPLPILGVILVFESLTLMMLIRDISICKADFSIALLVALTAGFLPYGFVIGLIAGTILAHLVKKGFTGFAD